MSCRQMKNSSVIGDQVHVTCSIESKCCQGYLSQVESAILNSNEPIHVCTQNEALTVNGETGIWANKTETDLWTGPVPINKYPINQDPCPQIITKKPKCVECKREVFVKYLEPPKIPAPGPIIINQEANKLVQPAPPIIIRQIPCKPVEPETLIIREAPPQQPIPPYEKIITIQGNFLPPPPRKVIIERLPEIPAKPQDIVLERWLPFKDEKRKIKLNPKPADPVQCKPRNIIINWEKIECCKINTDIKNLGIEKTDPETYTQQYGPTLKAASELPDIANEVKVLHGIPLASENTHKYYMELEGDIHALALIDLDKEGLSEYKHYLDFLKNPSDSLDSLQCENSNDIAYLSYKQDFNDELNSIVSSYQSRSESLKEELFQNVSDLDYFNLETIGLKSVQTESVEEKILESLRPELEIFKLESDLTSNVHIENIKPDSFPTNSFQIENCNHISIKEEKVESISTKDVIKDYIYNTVDKILEEKNIEEQYKNQSKKDVTEQGLADEEVRIIETDLISEKEIDLDELTMKELVEQKIREEEEQEPSNEIQKLDMEKHISEKNIEASIPFPSLIENSVEKILQQSILEQKQINEIEKCLQNKLKQEILKEQDKHESKAISEWIDETMNEKSLPVTISKQMTEFALDAKNEKISDPDTTMESEKKHYDQLSTVCDISFDQHDEANSTNSTASLEAAVDFLVEKLVKIVREGSFE